MKYITGNMRVLKKRKYIFQPFLNIFYKFTHFVLMLWRASQNHVADRIWLAGLSLGITALKYLTRRRRRTSAGQCQKNTCSSVRQQKRRHCQCRKPRTNHDQRRAKNVLTTRNLIKDVETTFNELKLDVFVGEKSVKDKRNGDKRSSVSSLLQDLCSTKNFQLKPAVVQCYLLPQVSHPRELKGIAWTDFKYERFRLQTYSDYPISAAQPALVLAREGFVYTGSGSDDKVTCYTCCVSKNSWLEKEVVSEVHKSLSPSCAMVTGRGSDNIPIVAGSDSFEEILKKLNGVNTNVQLNVQRSKKKQDTNVNDHVSQNRGTTSSVSPSARDTTSQNNSVSSRSDSNSLQAASGESAAKVDQNAASKSNKDGKGPTYSELGIVTERPKRQEYAVKGERLKTFSSWLMSHHIHSEDLADAGFYYAGYGDCARCFFCGGGLRNWEDEDDVWVEHARWFPKCAFIRHFMGQNFVDTVQELNKTKDKINFTMVVEHLGASASAVQLDIKTSKSNKVDKGPNCSELGIITERPRCPKYAFKTERMKTFSDWHQSHLSQVDDLADAGFYNAGLDTVSCFCCGGTLGNLKSRKCFLVEHARLYPECVYLRLHAGQDFIDTVLKLSKTQNQITLEDVRDQMERSGILSHFNISRACSKELPQKTTCKVCHDKIVEVVFLPCGHLVSCAKCAIVSENCPVSNCRKAITGMIRAFIS